MRRIRSLYRLFLALLLALAPLAGASSAPSLAERPNGAGLVVRFGDGRVVTAYVQFDEPAITGIELLQRAGIPITVAPFGGWGWLSAPLLEKVAQQRTAFVRPSSNRRGSGITTG